MNTFVISICLFLQSRQDASLHKLNRLNLNEILRNEELILKNETISDPMYQDGRSITSPSNHTQEQIFSIGIREDFFGCVSSFAGIFE